jgi:hypothetical protein
MCRDCDDLASSDPVDSTTQNKNRITKKNQRKKLLSICDGFIAMPCQARPGPRGCGPMVLLIGC